MHASAAPKWKEDRIYTEADYDATGEDEHVELIDGRLYAMAAPDRAHQEIITEMVSVIRNHIRAKGGDCKVYPGPFGVKLSKKKSNIVEPDISVICDKDKLTKRGCEGAPDWIIEVVSPSDPGHDYVEKLKLYNDAGVREYWIVDPLTSHVHVYRLEEDFGVTVYTFRDEITSGIFTDLTIDFTAIEALLK